MTITNFAIEYDSINSKNEFTSGDTINGRIIVEVSKETTVQALTFTAKGYAKVSWTEHRNHHHHGHHGVHHGVHHGPHGHAHTQHYWADEKYYDLKQHILRESREDGFLGTTMTIVNFSIEYDAINSKNTFTNGDTMNGRIILEVSKDVEIKYLLFAGHGYAHVSWDEYYGQYNHHVYWATEKYYSVKHNILRTESADGTEVIGQGRHVFPFSFNIPDRKMPSSFKDTTGKVVHKVKAELKQSMKFTKKAKAHFTFVSKPELDYPMLWDPQSGCKDKSLAFGSGSVTFDIHTKQMGYMQGNDIEVTVDIKNKSSRSVKPKFTLYEKRSFFAQGHRRIHTKDILKEKSEEVSSSDKGSFVKTIAIPKELPPSILNCSILKLEYRLKVELDIKYAVDPEVKLPIVVLPIFDKNTKQPPAANTPFGPNAYGNPIPNAYGNPVPNAFGNPVPNAFGNPAPNAFGNPVPNAYGNPVPNAYGNPVPNAYGNPAPNAYGNPAPNAFGNPAPNAFGNPAPPYWNNQPQYPSGPSMAYPPPPPYAAHAMYPTVPSPDPNQKPTK